MVRILPIALIVLSVGFHLVYCEWEIAYAADYQGADEDRVIFYGHQGSSTHGHVLPEITVLLARPGTDTDDATLFGMWLPALGIGIALLIWHVQRESERVGRRGI